MTGVQKARIHWQESIRDDSTYDKIVQMKRYKWQESTNDKSTYRKIYWQDSTNDMSTYYKSTAVKFVQMKHKQTSRAHITRVQNIRE